MNILKHKKCLQGVMLWTLGTTLVWHLTLWELPGNNTKCCGSIFIEVRNTTDRFQCTVAVVNDVVVDVDL